MLPSCLSCVILIHSNRIRMTSQFTMDISKGSCSFVTHKALLTRISTATELNYILKSSLDYYDNNSRCGVCKQSGFSEKIMDGALVNAKSKIIE